MIYNISSASRRHFDESKESLKLKVYALHTNHAHMAVVYLLVNHTEVINFILDKIPRK